MINCRYSYQYIACIFYSDLQFIYDLSAAAA